MLHPSVNVSKMLFMANLIHCLSWNMSFSFLSKIPSCLFCHLEKSRQRVLRKQH